MRVFAHCVRDLNKLNRIDDTKIDADHKVIFDLLKYAQTKGYKGFDDVAKFGAIAEDKDRAAMLGVVEILSRIFNMVDEEDFGIDLELSGLGKKLVFEPWAASLGTRRQHVREIIKNQFRVEGFPLPIVKGKLNSIVAPSHAGKTIYAMGLTITLARAGHKVVFLTTEEDEEAAVERTLAIDENDVAFKNISIIYHSSFNKNSLEAFVNKVSEEGYDFLVIDYLKKSMWENYSGDHVVMEEINSTILKAMAEMPNKISVFAFVQGNREAFSDKNADIDKLMEDTSKVALLIDGGMPVYRSADNLLFIKKTSSDRSLLVAKSRRNPELLGAKISYNVDLVNYNISMGMPIKKDWFGSSTEEQKTDTKSASKLKVGGNK
jgi:hypothetical protein